MDEFEAWIIGVLLSVVGAAVAVAAWMMTKWQERVEARLQQFHHHANVLQWLILTVTALYRKQFRRDPPSAPKIDEEWREP